MMAVSKLSFSSSVAPGSSSRFSPLLQLSIPKMQMPFSPTESFKRFLLLCGATTGRLEWDAKTPHFRFSLLSIIFKCTFCETEIIRLFTFIGIHWWTKGIFSNANVLGRSIRSPPGVLPSPESCMQRAIAAELRVCCWQRRNPSKLYYDHWRVVDSMLNTRNWLMSIAM